LTEEPSAKGPSSVGLGEAPSAPVGETPLALGTAELPKGMPADVVELVAPTARSTGGRTELPEPIAEVDKVAVGMADGGTTADGAEPGRSGQMPLAVASSIEKNTCYRGDF